VRKYNCPVCNTSLSRTAYEKALGIIEEKERLLESERAKIANENDGLKLQLKESQKKVAAAREDGIKAERARNGRLLAGKEAEIQKLKERLKQIQTGNTPQTDGLEFEATLCNRLKREFPEDRIQHKGKGGDVLQLVRFEDEPAGSIIYECKRTPSILTQHLRQTMAAKKQRDADFAILVTTGKRRGFNGFSQMDGVLVVCPLVVVHICCLLRAHLMEMTRVKLDRQTRAAIAQKLMTYITGTEFRNYIERIIRFSTELQETLETEIKEHLRGWEKRQNYYQTINHETNQMQRNLNLVLHGREPRLIDAPKQALMPIRQRVAVRSGG